MKSDQRQFASPEDTTTRGAYGIPEYYAPTWFDAELKKRAEARKGEAKPKRRLVRGSR